MHHIQNANSPTNIWEHWEPPNLQWLKGIAGCGKSTWLVNNFIPDNQVGFRDFVRAGNDHPNLDHQERPSRQHITRHTKGYIYFDLDAYAIIYSIE